MFKKSSLLIVSSLAIAFATTSSLYSLSSTDEKKAVVATHEDASAPSKEDIAKLSKTFGNFLGRTLLSPAIGIPFDLEGIIQGMRDGAEGKPAPLTEQEYEKLMISIQETTLEKLATENLETAETFLKDNGKKSDVKSLEDGKLQYTILEEGTGPAVKEDAQVLLNYTGKLQDGTVFGSSDETGPITLSLDHTIPGFGKGIVGMKQGEKRRLFIHPDLAYGTSGDLPPNSLLIFDIEVLNASLPKDVDADTMDAPEESEDKSLSFSSESEYDRDYEMQKMQSYMSPRSEAKKNVVPTHHDELHDYYVEEHEINDDPSRSQQPIYAAGQRNNQNARTPSGKQPYVPFSYDNPPANTTPNVTPVTTSFAPTPIYNTPFYEGQSNVNPAYNNYYTAPFNPAFNNPYNAPPMNSGYYNSTYSPYYNDPVYGAPAYNAAYPNQPVYTTQPVYGDPAYNNVYYGDPAYNPAPAYNNPATNTIVIPNQARPN